MTLHLAVVFQPPPTRSVSLYLCSVASSIVVATRDDLLDVNRQNYLCSATGEVCGRVKLVYVWP